ncbi:hypothetical protein HaLaN_04702 [Haematococcus lacustris]|uniref:Uncharacterized protein n=1 Tax=Haematococcus lacustris TaxID=44745 RepID=A0A699YRI2_HAELA|nr:hypothetical protein HaLaN_04702 [Haematococcus lacustris]
MQASKFAELLVKQREKESAVREAFVYQVERYLPLELLHKAGLLPAELPYPSVSVSGAPPSLALLTLQDTIREGGAADLEDEPLFLYSKALLRPGAPLPASEAPTPIIPALPDETEVDSGMNAGMLLLNHHPQ